MQTNAKQVMTSYIAKRIQHRKRTLAKIATKISRSLTLQLINLLTQLIQSNPINLTHKFTNLLSILLIQNFPSNPLIAKKILSNYKSSKINPIQSKSNPPIPQSPNTTLNPAKFSITIPYS